MTDDQIILHLSLGRITFLSFLEKKKLLKNLDSSDALALLSISDIENLINRNLSKKVLWNGKENLRMAKISFEYCKKLNIKILFNFEDKYPENLRQIADPPYLLFYRGNVSLLNGKNISVVGTRHLTSQGKIASKQFAYDAVLDSCNVVSGLAYGADSFAHKGAVDAYFDFLEKEQNIESLGKTIAVMPSSIDKIYPVAHKRLAEQILQSGGLIISEYEPNLEMAKWHFVGRNRIIAGLSLATVVIEAPTGSGALITADFALDYGRDVFFHKVAFSEAAKKTSLIVEEQLKRDFEAKKVSQYKVENTVEKFLDSGAPIINDYADFCSALNEEPGKRDYLLLQKDLFDV